MSPVAAVLVVAELTEEEAVANAAAAAALDEHNLGDAAVSYTPSEALARIIASEDGVVGEMMTFAPAGYTAEPQNDEASAQQAGL